MIRNFAFVKAASTAAAIKALGTQGARVMAGGTDLLGCLRDEVFAADRVVSISGLKELVGVSARPDGGVRIGALTTIAEIASNPTIRSRYAVLAEAAGEVASPQLRNQGTIGGNLCQKPRCWYYRGDFHCARKGGDLCYAVEGENEFHAIFGGGPCFYVHPSDTAVALTALEARLTVSGPSGNRQVRIADFFMRPDTDITRETVLAPAEILTEIVLPPPGASMRSTYRKIRARRAWDFALVSVALVLQFTGESVGSARIVLGGVGPLPWRVEAAEKLLAGRRIDAAAATATGQAAVAEAGSLRDNEYKVLMTRGAVEETLLALA
jgi:xanthine dehydrogenase YagS FAD-binding subunit